MGTGLVEAPERPSPASPAVESIAPEQLTLIAAAHAACHRIRRAATIATISGWTTASFAGICLLSGIFSLRALLLGVGLAVIAFVELRNARRLRAFDIKAPRTLALNQLALALMVSLYAAWGVGQALLGPGAYDAYLESGFGGSQTLTSLDRLNRAVMVVFYLIVIGATVIAQGSTALYYFTRRGHIDHYLRRTPAWVVDTLRATS